MKNNFLFILIFTIAGQIAFGQSKEEWKSKVDPVVLNKIQAGPTEFMIVMKEQADLSQSNMLDTKEEKGNYVYKTLVETARHSQASVISLLDELKLDYKQYWIANAYLVKGDLNAISQLANLPAVAQIIENASYAAPKPVVESFDEGNNRAVEWGLTQINADKAWALGYKGQGAVVGGEDTGYDWTHPAIKKKYRGWNGTTVDHNYNWHDAITSGNGGICGLNSKVPCDDQQHGTHTMGTMVGDDGAGNQIGVAPMAKWIGARNMDQGAGTLASYVDCFQWFLAPTDLNNANPNPSKSPHVINNSWGCDISEGCNSSNFSTIQTAINNLVAAGIVVVGSAGNSGPNCSTITDPPAMFDKTFSIGSTTSSDAISSFSSRGPVTVYTSNEIKPNVSAPGSSIRSSVPGAKFATMSGTSMAGPHVVGLVALLISANPSLAGHVDVIEKIIEQTAVKLTSTQNCGSVSGSSIPNYTFGNGRIDALAAVKIALTTSVKKNNEVEATVNTYPNPFTKNITFELSNWKTSLRFELCAITGQILISELWSFSQQTHELDLSNLAPGIYFYKLANDTYNYKGKIMKGNF